MELVKEHTVLIEKLVKSNPKYSGNEDLLEDFCSETYQKSYLILQSVTDEKSLELYLKKVVSSAIMDVLKNSGRVVRSTKGYKSIKEIPIMPESSKSAEETGEIQTEIVNEVSEQEEVVVQQEYEEIEVTDNRHLSENIPPVLMDDLANIKDPKESIEEQVIRKDIIENIIDMVRQIDAENPQEKYMKIFYMRYFLQKKQRDIAQEIGISQPETSKRLVSLSRLIKEKLY